jgi:hypothetical protein
MHIDPKAPASSPQHPRNWRQPQFLAPSVYTVAEPPAAPATPPAKKAPPKKPAGKKVTHRAKPDLATALAKLGEQ